MQQSPPLVGMSHRVAWLLAKCRVDRRSRLVVSPEVHQRLSSQVGARHIVRVRLEPLFRGSQALLPPLLAGLDTGQRTPVRRFPRLNPDRFLDRFQGLGQPVPLMHDHSERIKTNRLIRSTVDRLASLVGRPVVLFPFEQTDRQHRVSDRVFRVLRQSQPKLLLGHLESRLLHQQLGPGDVLIHDRLRYFRMSS